MNQKKVYTAPQISELGSVKDYVQTASDVQAITDADNCDTSQGPCYRFASA